jgi:hypothetical protein
LLGYRFFSAVWTSGLSADEHIAEFYRAAAPSDGRWPAQSARKCAAPDRPCRQFHRERGFYYHISEFLKPPFVIKTTRDRRQQQRRIGAGFPKTSGTTLKMCRNAPTHSNKFGGSDFVKIVEGFRRLSVGE